MVVFAIVTMVHFQRVATIAALAECIASDSRIAVEEDFFGGVDLRR
jgi:hypothetical protein